MKLQQFYQSPPKKSHLFWALPIGILICAFEWYFEAGMYGYGGFYRLSRSEIEYFYSLAAKNYVISALIGSIPILVANWSRTLWPRLAVTVALVAVQLITGSIYILTPRAV